jgi:hypothetical protein
MQAFHKLVWDRAAPFSTATYEEDEARRVQAQNEQLAERDRMFEEQRRQSAPDEPGPTPWWRR